MTSAGTEEQGTRDNHDSFHRPFLRLASVSKQRRGSPKPGRGVFQ